MFNSQYGTPNAHSPPPVPTAYYNSPTTMPTPPPILITGAGPTGLVLALSLAKQGLHPRIIDKFPPPGQPSRAAAVPAHHLEFYHQLSPALAHDAVTAGIVMDH